MTNWVTPQKLVGFDPFVYHLCMDNFIFFLQSLSFSFIFSLKFLPPWNFIKYIRTKVLQIYSCPLGNCVSIFGCPATILVVAGTLTTKISNAGDYIKTHLN